VSVQSLLVVATSVLLIFALYLFFGRTLYGRRCGRRRSTARARAWSACRPNFAGALTFTLASLLCAFSGVLIGPITTIYYDSEFLISLKVSSGRHRRAVELSARRRGLAAGGLIESFSSFWASAFKE